MFYTLTGTSTKAAPAATGGGSSSSVLPIASNTPTALTSQSNPSAAPNSSPQATTSSSADSGSGSGSGGLSIGDIAGVAGAIIGALGLILSILAWKFPTQRKKTLRAIGLGRVDPPPKYDEATALGHLDPSHKPVVHITIA